MDEKQELNLSKNTKSVSRTLAILLTFVEDSPYQRVSDIAEKLGMNISTVSRHLTTMLDMGFLERDDVTGRYFLGIQIIALAGVALHSYDSFRHAHPELQHLSNKLGVHCYMGVPRGESIIHLISICAENTAELFMPIGHRHPMYCTAIGRCILASYPTKKVDAILNNSQLTKYTEDTKLDVAEIKREVAKAKSRGYSVLINELAEGKFSIAAPVYDRSRNVVAAVSVSGDIYEANFAQREMEMAKATVAAAGRISAKLGYFFR